MKILLLEDSNFQRKIMVSKLKPLNCDIRECVDAEEAIVYLEANNFDLVISDLNLPNMSGVEFIKALRKFNPNIPIVGITSPGESSEDSEQAIKAGAICVLEKPIQNLDKIREILATI